MKTPDGLEKYQEEGEYSITCPYCRCETKHTVWSKFWHPFRMPAIVAQCHECGRDYVR